MGTDAQVTPPARVSAVIVNWNGGHHLRICLPSLLEQNHQLLEILVVDNASTDDSSLVASEFGAKWVPLERNAGLAPAFNRGARMASGEFLLFVNNDMRFDPDFVKALLEPLLNDAHAFASDGLQYDWHGSKAVHLATRLAKSRPLHDSTVEFVPELFFYPQAVSTPTSVFMGSAACMLIRQSAFRELGGFDDRLPLGYEDTEICWRAATVGWKTVFVPGAICWHHVGASGRSREGARFNFRGILIGRLVLATKLLPARYVLLTWLVSCAGLLKDVGRLQWHFAKDRLGVLFKVAFLLPQLIKERVALFRSAGITPEGQLDRFLQLTLEDASSVKGCAPEK
jgi:GT2 family glycosyltransferase